MAVVACLVVAAGVTAFLLINAKNAAAAEQKAKAEAVAQMGAYTDNATGVSFQVPIGWEQIPLEDALKEMSTMGAVPAALVAFGDGNPRDGTTRGAMMMFAPQEYPSGAHLSPKNMLDELARAMKDTAPSGMSIAEGVTETKGTALAGAEITIAYSSAGNTAKMRLTFLDSGSRYYVFGFVADERGWDQDKYFFEGTVESFSVLGAR